MGIGTNVFPTVAGKPFTDIAAVYPGVIEETRHPKLRRQSIHNIPWTSSLLWTSTALTSIGAIALSVLVPRSCEEVPQCRDAKDAAWSEIKINTGSFTSPTSRVVAFGVLLVKQLTSLYLALQERRNENTLALALPDPVRPLCLLCTAVTVLIILELSFASNYIWAHAVPPLSGEGWRPVYSARYAEWMINVPILQIISGYYTLGRPFVEVIYPILVTDAYIYLAWLALVVDVEFARVSFVVLSFIGYGIASVLMFRWVYRFKRTSSPDMPRRLTRMVVTVLLVIDFGIYGVVYLLAYLGVITSQTEGEAYGIMDFNTKLAATFILASFRSADRQACLRHLVMEHSYFNSAFMSLLRSNSDHVVLCKLDAFGRCILPDDRSPDLLGLSCLLGKPVAGMVFSDLISTTEGRKRFEEHLRGTRMQDKFVEASTGNGLRDPRASFQQAPEIARVLNYDLACGAYDSGMEGSPKKSVRVCIHLSIMVSQPSDQCPKQIVLALRIDDRENGPEAKNDKWTSEDSQASPVKWDSQASPVKAGYSSSPRLRSSRPHLTAATDINWATEGSLPCILPSTHGSDSDCATDLECGEFNRSVSQGLLDPRGVSSDVDSTAIQSR